MQQIHLHWNQTNQYKHLQLFSVCNVCHHATEQLSFLFLSLLIGGRDIGIAPNRRGNGLDNILIEILHQEISFPAWREEDPPLSSTDH